jgi:hypothetical protein
VRKVQWQFQVGKVEKIDGQDCYAVDVKCMAAGGRDAKPTRLWLNKNTLGLEQIEEQLPIQGKYKPVKERYKAQGRTAPVFVPITAIPLDMPVFLPSEDKGTTDFGYQAIIPDEEGKKALDDVGFKFQVKQTTQAPNRDELKDLVAEEFTKGLAEKKVLEFKFEAGRRKARQIWQEGQPWPLYSSNGLIEAQLIEVKPAKD